MGRTFLKLFLAGTTLLIAVGAGYVAYRWAENGVPPVPEAVTEAMQDPEMLLPIPGTGSSAEATLDDPGRQPWLEAELVSGVVRISGVVPDAQSAVSLLASSRITYGVTVNHEIQVSPYLADPEWLAGAAEGLALLPMITEGTIRVEEGVVTLTGVAPSRAHVDAFERAVRNAFPGAERASDITISNLAAPSFVARRQGATLVLSGVLPNELIREYIVGGVAATYGAETVVDDMTIDDGRYTAFWMYTMPELLGSLEPFADYEVRIENGVTSGSLNDGANFESGSSMLDDTTQAVLDVAVRMLQRDRSLAMTVEGHTDSVGSRQFNQTLSEARAQSAVDYLLGRGVDVNRITSAGYGEDRPAASNDTADGRAANRRVVLIFEPADVATA